MIGLWDWLKLHLNLSFIAFSVVFKEKKIKEFVIYLYKIGRKMLSACKYISFKVSVARLCWDFKLNLTFIVTAKIRIESVCSKSSRLHRIHGTLGKKLKGTIDIRLSRSSDFFLEDRWVLSSKIIKQRNWWHKKGLKWSEITTFRICIQNLISKVEFYWIYCL